MSELISVFAWWALVQVFGAVGLPVAFRLFGRLPDRGYGVSKALGLLLASYVFWLMGVLGFLRNSSGSMIFSLIIVAVLAALFYRRAGASAPTSGSDDSPPSLSAWLRAHWRLVLLTEILFAFTFAGWVLYRAYVPRIMTAGGEKFMELAFLNGIQRSDSLPPLDPWLSGYAISYYYFGYLMMSILIRLSGVAPAVGFNIGGGLLFALTATGAFSLVYNLVSGAKLKLPARIPRKCGSDSLPATRITLPLNWSWVFLALLGVVFVVLLSNFEAPLEIAHWNGIGSDGLWKWLDIADLDQPPSTFASDQSATRLTRPGWWWWRASRVIFDYDVRDWAIRSDISADPAPHRRENIDEFPFFSFLLGDMHPHVLALPYVLLALSASLLLYHAGVAARNEFSSQWLPVLGVPGTHLLLLALAFGALGFLNTWDFPIQWAVAVAAYALGRLYGSGTFVLKPHLRPVLSLAATLAIGGLALYLPFYGGFQSQAGGPLVHVHSPTRLSQFIVMFGPLLFIIVSFLAWGVWRARQSHEFFGRQALSVALILLALVALIVLGTALVIVLKPEVRSLVAPTMANEDPSSIALRYLNMRFGVPWVSLLLVGVISTATALLRCTRFDHAARFSILLIIAGAVMTLIPDYVYLKDVFGVRINTVFKFYFQAWVLWAVAAAGAVYALLSAEDRLGSPARWVLGAALALVVALGLLYPVLAIPDRAQEFPEAPTLDGTAYLAEAQPGDYAAAKWMNASIKGAPVILEKPGGAYQYEGRVSVLTGLPTLLGWAGHEQQWRGNTVEQDKRLPAIRELCTTTDESRTLTLLDEYDINFVYVGPLERNECPPTGLQKFDRLMDIVYDQDGVTIYKRRDVKGSPIGE
jgi:YYY domain-containing protein